jgi:Domain of unknown function (DUF6504)
LSAADLRGMHFFDQPIQVSFRTAPAKQKLPHCPDSFTWEGRTYQVLETLSEWTDFRRRGKMERNMSPEHALAAAERGSLNVGRFFFRVRVDTGQLLDIYYDRALKSIDDRKGQWFIYREVAPG